MSERLIHILGENKIKFNLPKITIDSTDTCIANSNSKYYLLMIDWIELIIIISIYYCYIYIYIFFTLILVQLKVLFHKISTATSANSIDFKIRSDMSRSLKEFLRCKIKNLSSIHNLLNNMFKLYSPKKKDLILHFPFIFADFTGYSPMSKISQIRVPIYTW